MNPIDELCRAYRSGQIDLVLGAGVSARSGVPLYLKMALLLVKRVSDEGLIPNAPSSVVTILNEQLDKLQNNQPISTSFKPEEVILFIQKYLSDKNGKILRVFIQKILYENVKLASRNLVSRRTYRQNTTLDSIIRFCAVIQENTDNSITRHKIEPNSKIHAILTTNYDCLLEASFATKFRYLLKPVARETSSEARRGQRLIPVYHIHGYISAFSSNDSSDDEYEASKLVIAEDDYFRTFYDPKGFTDLKAAQFFQKRTCLFIGSAMIDVNLRRFLYFAVRKKASTRTLPKHFAIMRMDGRPEDEFTESILQTYGVDVIRIKEYSEIDEILCQVYTSVKGMTQESWNDLRKIERSGN